MRVPMISLRMIWMINSNYYFQKLILINSAGYEYAELPLDASVSLVAPNNTGKTSLINALQYLLIIDRKRLNFGAHDKDKSRRFYFPGQSSYIMLEAILPEGTVVLGAVGSGLDRDYRYFAYKGSYKKADFVLPDNSLVQQPKFVERLAEQGKTVHKIKKLDFANVVYGRGDYARSKNMPDFSLFKLKNKNNASAYQRVLTSILRLDKLNSSDVKAHLLDIFKADLYDHKVDFKKDWDEAFKEVNYDKKQLEAATAQLSNIQQLESLQQERLALRGKLLFMQPLLNEALAKWDDHYQHQKQSFAQKIQACDEFLSGLQQKSNELNQQQARAEIAVDRLNEVQAEQEALAQQYALTTEAQLLAVEKSVKQELEELIGLLHVLKSRAPQAIADEVIQRERELSQLQNQRQNIENNLWQKLAEEFNEVQLAYLNKMLNPQIFSLPPEKFELSLDKLVDWVNRQGADWLTLPGLRFANENLHVNFSALTKEALDVKISDCEKQLQQLQQQLEAAKKTEILQSKKTNLDNQLEQARTDIQRFNQLQKLQASAEQRAKDLATNSAVIEEAARQLEALDTERKKQFELQEDLRKVQLQLAQQNKTIEEQKQRRQDQLGNLANLVSLPRLPFVGHSELKLDELAGKLVEFNQGCLKHETICADIGRLIGLIEHSGLTKFTDVEEPEAQIANMVNFANHLDSERESVEKKARIAVVSVAMSLNNLRNSLYTLDSKTVEFNRLISRRQLSDLKTFKVRITPDEELVEAIDLVLMKAKAADSGETYNIFDTTNSVLDDKALDKAKQLLADKGQEYGGLEVKNLFELQFVLAKHDQKEDTFSDIDSAASNGTVLMAKLVCGLAMLSLMQVEDQKKRVNAICYLDEALALDSKNQASLINTAAEFGFALIFASPDPLETVDYMVPISHKAGKNFINPKSWVKLERKAVA